MCHCESKHRGERSSALGASAARRTTVTVVAGSKTRVIDLAALPVRKVDGLRGVCLADVWSATELDGELLTMGFDFVADDGFRMSDHDRTRLQGLTLGMGYISRATRNLFWHPKLALPCYCRVKAVAMILAEDMTASIAPTTHAFMGA